MKLLLFDVDGTLTKPRIKVTQDMLDALQFVKDSKKFDIGFVGGSDLKKQIEQLGEENFDLFDWRFAENGLQGFYKTEEIHKKSFVGELGETHFKELINCCLRALANAKCPVKRGTFIEYRNGMINISPVGRACSQSEREEFNEFDNLFKIRENLILDVQEQWKTYIEFKHLTLLPKLKFSIGGQISVDVFPEGWDKTYCLQFVEHKYDEIHFFGDKTMEGGNDYEIFHDERVIGHTVKNYTDTIHKIIGLL